MDYDHAQIFFDDGTVLSTETKIDPDVVYEGGKDYWGFQHIRQIEDFYRAVEENVEPAISGREALKIQKLICEIYRVGRENFTKSK
jgi:predicted dehydrogenase